MHVCWVKVRNSCTHAICVPLPHSPGLLTPTGHRQALQQTAVRQVGLKPNRDKREDTFAALFHEI